MAGSPVYDFFLAHAGADTEPAERLHDVLVESSEVFLHGLRIRHQAMRNGQDGVHAFAVGGDAVFEMDVGGRGLQGSGGPTGGGWVVVHAKAAAWSVLAADVGGEMSMCDDYDETEARCCAS